MASLSPEWFDNRHDYIQDMERSGHKELTDFLREHGFDISDMHTISLVCEDNGVRILPFIDYVFTNDGRKYLHSGKYATTFIKPGCTDNILNILKASSAVAESIAAREIVRQEDLLRAEKNRQEKLRREEDEAKVIESKIAEAKIQALTSQNVESKSSSPQVKDEEDARISTIHVAGFWVIYSSFAFLIMYLNDYQAGLGGILFLGSIFIAISYPMIKYIFKEGISGAPQRIKSLIKAVAISIAIIFAITALSKCTDNHSMGDCYYRVGCM